ncbi:16190_t:CDS:2 [Funneliformis caledonium]|uniref:16190_t:CDS:1 n=1 Tax=Funneliformis caledonium TaxID=1117310 RepID=A0A9N9GGE1_9GLOM|nr:16190_t:CDS:2 [Funneliformis caledonium]
MTLGCQRILLKLQEVQELKECLVHKASYYEKSQVDVSRFRTLIIDIRLIYQLINSRIREIQLATPLKYQSKFAG